MQTYMVGGAVRDMLLGKTAVDRDWVVVGATAEELERRGYQRVGADFPVFLHPLTHEEYALARTERKNAPGHRGFVVHASPEVTLEEDLGRRDLTINAIAMTEAGALVDPYGGEQDLRAGVLRAVGGAFREDPLRILRVARFASQLPGFIVAGVTMRMMHDMCAEGALGELPGERVWGEVAKVLLSPAPGRFFDVLFRVGGISPFFDELAAIRLLTVPVGFSAHERFAFWCASLSAEDVRSVCRRMKAPNEYRDFALQVVAHSEVLASWRQRPSTEVARSIAAVGGYHDADRLDPVLQYLRKCGSASELEHLKDVVLRTNRTIRAADYSETGPALGAALLSARAAAIEEAQAL